MASHKTVIISCHIRHRATQLPVVQGGKVGQSSGKAGRRAGVTAAGSCGIQSLARFTKGRPTQQVERFWEIPNGATELIQKAIVWLVPRSG